MTFHPWWCNLEALFMEKSETVVLLEMVEWCHWWFVFSYILSWNSPVKLVEML